MAVASPPPSAGRSHPTYKEMVVQALMELRESGGSTSRDAISKYIADHFSGLPARHDDLLSVHLRRLRSQGLLLMSGYSYFLTSGPNPPPPPPPRGRGRPRKTAFPAQKRGPGRPRKSSADLSSSSAPFQRGPGRPRKSSADLSSSSAPFQGVNKRRPGRPRKNPIPMSVPHTTMPAVKRGRGRPPKQNAQILRTAASQSVTLVTIAKSSAAASNIVTSVRRGRGRPPKLLRLPAYSTIPIPFPAAPSLVAGMRKRGRPPKEKRPPVSPTNDKPELVQSVALTRRGPGRPRKEERSDHLKAGVEAQSQAADQAADVRNGGEVKHLPSSSTTSLTEKRGRGRPRKRPLETQATETGIIAALVEKRGPGRPRKKNPSAPLSVETESVAMSGYKRGRGRPRKRQLETETTETEIIAALVEKRGPQKRGPGRPRKENPSAPLSVETESVAMSGYKRGRGRPRKRPLETETIETGIIAALVEKRGPGRPRKENPSAGTSAETGIVSSMGNKRGRGRPRKDVSFLIEAEVSRDLSESKPKKEDTSVSGNETGTESILSGAGMEAMPTYTRGSVVSGEKASTAHVEAESAMLGVDPIISNLDMDNRSF
ncbi:hypothetical protein QOZ80_5AG0360660 [Eleusine coracana subsp. coracana]|nr:hypothetical protein QOZ80_5AG0360660 [Eleusine coracana subsp. coracana]